MSVIVPARNAAWCIDACLSAIAASDFPQHLLEVLLVDNGSRDDTLSRARSYQERLPLRTLEFPFGFISAVRNAGAAAAAGRIVAFVDADCLVSRNWISSVANLLSGDAKKIVGGWYRIPEASTWVARSWFEFESRQKTGPVAFIPAGALALPQELFRQARGFDERLETNEDFEFCFRARQLDIPIESVDALAVVHLGTPQDVSSFFLREWWHGTSVAQVFLRNVRGMANIKAVGFAMFTLVSVAGILLGCIAAATGWGISILAGCSTALLLVCFGLALRMAILRRTRSRYVPHVAFLHLVYGFARALALVLPRAKKRPRSAAVASQF